MQQANDIIGIQILDDLIRYMSEDGDDMEIDYADLLDHVKHRRRVMTIMYFISGTEIPSVKFYRDTTGFQFIPPKPYILLLLFHSKTQLVMPFAAIHERTVQKVLKPPSTIQLDKLHYYELPAKATQHQKHIHELKSKLGNSYSKMVSHQRQSI